MHTITNGKLEATIKSFGAELWNLKDVETGEDFMWEADSKFWGKKAPILFPFIGESRDGKFTYKGKEYPGTRHGFARDNEFELVEKLEDKVVFRLSSTEASLKDYPFEFDFYVTYSLVEDELITDFKVVNKGTNEMFFNLGGHPAFATPTNDEIKYEDYYLEFEKPEDSKTYEIVGALIGRNKKPSLDGNKLNLTVDMFDYDALVFDDLKSQVITIRNTKNTKSVRVEYKDFPIMAIWSTPGASFVCIEPWCGVNDFVDATGNIEEKYGIQKLEAKKTFERTLKFQVSL